MGEIGSSVDFGVGQNNNGAFRATHPIQYPGFGFIRIKSSIATENFMI